ncbi:mechanosensitive ion channel family protein [Haloquadratum walsbyi]|jgi:small-conductance mechanosensitive channel|uniref:Mechanosensitive channel protein MscS n=1 Tax=Haloquadratum walsbyi (strain DSM 16854 / JCM 12705 / C23) TaxID=768065 RepID=G0LJ50_HALWC|nr:mechanosensitive ion channel family protein [Haloquadratum walsbyi]CCC40618.1 mechanosensitive channel protein MscS [Haloquadratum walsbyi C23]
MSIIFDLTTTPLQVGVDLSGSIARLLTRAGLPETIAGLTGQAIAFIAVFALIFIGGRTIIIRLLERVLDSRDIEAHARKPLRRIVVIAIGFVALTIGFGAAGYGNFLQSLATVAAAATLAVGFALQDVLKNFVAGVFIYADRPFKIGDWIEWNGHAGVVQDISFRVTRVRTFNNELLTVPNSTLTDGVIKNPVANERLRMQVPFGISYNDDIDAASAIIHEAADDHADILTEPEPTVRLSELGDSAVTLQSQVWIDNPSRGRVAKARAQYVQMVKERFDQHEIDMPYPNRTLEGEVTIAGGSIEQS